MTKTYTYSHTIYFADTDAAKVVHHSNYLRYFEAARIDMLKQIGYPYKDMQSERIGLAPIHIDIKYKKPMVLEDIYVVHTSVQTLKKASVTLLQQLFVGESLHCEAVVRLACLDEAAYRPIAIPETLYQLFS